MADGTQSSDGNARSGPGDIPLGRPTAARMYDEALGGKDHFEVDRAANARLYELIGESRVRATAWENRRFLGRVVEYLSNECGIRQFLDVGSGLPTVRNTHEIALEANPDARVVYVDIDPIVAAHGQALLRSGTTRVITADMRDPASILDHPTTREMIDFRQPVAVLFIAVFHFVTAMQNPAGIVAAFRERQAPGSYVAISHLSTDGMSLEEQNGWHAGFAGATVPLVLRGRSEIRSLFHGYDLVEPGLVRPWEWRPGDLDSPRTASLFGAVGVKRLSIA
ncbi:SAM-dependent methyltransferase [Nocardia brasiliensis]|uniref:SAM-dependent methyltransferase n=1 Tax=Nocardia brasiliensis TaxID=37326 RepID=UPI0024583CBA|nr:SAM-dependent methyltransferase [Nocardia brasiliensis]